jgi:hypothetical protein
VASSCVGAGVLVAQALYGIAGCGGVLGEGLTIGSWSISTDFLFPSLYFAEFNFLTFIFEVAPITAIAAGLLTYISLRFVFDVRV